MPDKPVIVGVQAKVVINSAMYGGRFDGSFCVRWQRQMQWPVYRR